MSQPTRQFQLKEPYIATFADAISHSKLDGTLAKELLGLSEKMMQLEGEIADAVKKLRNAYSSIFHDLETILMDGDENTTGKTMESFPILSDTNLMDYSDL